MRQLLLILILLGAANTYAQMPLSAATWTPGIAGYSPLLHTKSLGKKWELTSYKSISAGFGFTGTSPFSMLSAPMGLQLSRRLSDHVYAFAGVSAAPFVGQFWPVATSPLIGKSYQSGGLFNSTNYGLYSSVNMGLMYINPEKIFSISGSIHVDRGYSPVYNMNRTYDAHQSRLF